MIVRRIGVCALLVAPGLAFATPVVAQSQEVLDRLGRLERSVQDLQAEVLTGGASPGTGLSPAAGAQFEVRLQELERAVRDLTGRVEELDFKYRLLEDRFEVSQADMELRMQGGGEAAGPVIVSSASSSAPVAAQPAPLADGGPIIISGANTAAPAPAPIPAPSSGVVATAAPAGQATVLPQGAPAEDYNNAYALLLQADYSGAEQAFSRFLQTHPNDPLAGNAQYWLGETYYVRENYQQAAIHFAEGYKNYPDGPKAPANLLKLGMSLGRIGRTADACASFRELDTRFPDSNVLQYARTERQRFGCA